MSSPSFSTSSSVEHVSDTALWVAAHRAFENERPKPLFRDPFAAALAGETGRAIAYRMRKARFTAWTVCIRTLIIDAMIERLISQEGVDTVLNLGCGLDARPYRMQLPSQIKWVEVDFPHMISYKEKILEPHSPHCHLQRVSLDLTDRTARQKLFQSLGEKASRVLVLTEGVIPYLTLEDVRNLAADLKKVPSFQYWIAEYLSQDVIRHLQSSKMKKMLSKAPFQFAPQNWLGFFHECGWDVHQMEYLSEVSQRVGRTIPAPWIFRMFLKVAPQRMRESFNHMSAFVTFKPSMPSG